MAADGHDNTVYERGEDHHNAKLNEEAVRAIRWRYASGNYSYRELSIGFGTSRTNVHRIVLRKSWAHVK